LTLTGIPGKLRTTPAGPSVSTDPSVCTKQYFFVNGDTVAVPFAVDLGATCEGLSSTLNELDRNTTVTQGRCSERARALYWIPVPVSGSVAAESAVSDASVDARLNVSLKAPRTE
jgi:hypothetical protein